MLLRCELCKARYAKRRHTTQDPEQDADDQDDRRLNTEASAVDSASVPPTCCSGRQAERRHPTQDPEQTAPPHPEHLDEQDADEQGDGPSRARPRQDTSAVDSVPMQYCSGCKQTLPLSGFPTKNNKILRNCVRCKAKNGNRRPPRAQAAPPQIGQDNIAPPPASMSERKPRGCTEKENGVRRSGGGVSRGEECCEGVSKGEESSTNSAADYDHHGVPVFYRRGERADDTPAMQQARRDKVSISRAHRAQARDDLQPSPSQTPPLPDIMRGRQELEALHRRHEEERMAGASPSPTPAIRKHTGQRRDRAVSPSPSSPFSRLSSSLRSPSVASQTSSMASQTISMAESLGSEYQPSSHGSHPEPSFPQSSHPSTLPPLPTPDADVPYIEGTTTRDDLAITNTDIDCIKSWRENLDKNKQQRCDRCNCF
ncbi:hypothetical protein E4U44_003127, partial [Claviceps purpurea]